MPEDAIRKMMEMPADEARETLDMIAQQYRRARKLGASRAAALRDMAAAHGMSDLDYVAYVEGLERGRPHSVPADRAVTTGAHRAPGRPRSTAADEAVGLYRAAVESGIDPDVAMRHAHKSTGVPLSTLRQRLREVNDVPRARRGRPSRVNISMGQPQASTDIPAFDFDTNSMLASLGELAWDAGSRIMPQVAALSSATRYGRLVVSMPEDALARRAIHAAASQGIGTIRHGLWVTPWGVRDGTGQITKCLEVALVVAERQRDERRLQRQQQQAWAELVDAARKASKRAPAGPACGSDGGSDGVPPGDLDS